MIKRPLTIKEQFELFVYRVEMLQITRLIQTGFNLSFNMKINNNKRLSFNIQEPDEDDLRSFLLTFRQFYASNEPIYLPRILNLCYQHITDEFIKNELVELRQLWQNEKNIGGIRFMYNNKELSPEETTLYWINGFYFHNDTDKFNLLSKLQPFELTIVRTIFLDHLIQASKYVFFVGNILRKVLKEN
ncbi:MAG: hypothetical protein AB7S75_09115 [Desulfococcaceae bacterium]